MISRTENPNVYTDLSGLNAISRQGRENSVEGMRQVAEQFEAIFLNMMLKQMRQSHASLFEDNYLSSNEMEFHQENFDNQISQHLAGAGGIGLADTLHRQLMSRFDVQDQARPQRTLSLEERPVAGQSLGRGFVSQPDGPRDARVQTPARPEVQSPEAVQPSVIEVPFSGPEDFVRRLRPLAEPVAEELGVDPEVLLAQAALETGWGRKVPGGVDGRNSHNLFGIKADSRWEGERVSVNTLEYRDGVAARERASFRAYESWEASFEDYADFLRSNPRYAEALENSHDAGQFLQSLQQAGYATDPVYAEKIDGVMRSPALQTAMDRDRGESAYRVN